MPPDSATPASPEDTVVLAALQTDARPPPEAAFSTPPAPATPTSPEDAVALAALPTDTRPPAEAAPSPPPAPATSAPPEDAVALAALPTDARPPPEEALSTPPAPATPPPPENAVAFAEIEAAGLPGVEEVVAAPPESAATLTPIPVPANTPTRDWIAEPVHLVGAESVDPARAPAAPEPAEMVDSAETATPSVDSRELVAEVRNIDEVSDYSPLLEAAPTPPESAKAAPLENAEVLIAVEDVGLTPAEEVASTPLEPATAPSIEPAPVDARTSESVPEPARLVGAESVDPARAAAGPEPAELVDSAETATPSVDSRELVAEVRNIDEVSDYSPLLEAAPTPPESAKAAPLENAEVLIAVEDVGLTPAEEVASTPLEPATAPSIEPAPVDARTSESVPEPARLVGAESVDPARAAAGPEPAEMVDSAETATPSVDSWELATEVSDIDEATDDSSLPEAAPTPPESAKIAPLKNAEVLIAVEDVGLTPAEEVASTPLEPAITPSIEPAPVDARASESVPEPARLVTVESIGPAHALATVEPAEIVASVELALEIVSSQEIATLVPEIDEATTVSPLPAAISTPPGPTTSPTLEEVEVLAATETAGSPRLEAAVSSPPVPAETIGPAEEVTMRAAIDPTALKPAPGGPEAQQAQQAPDADDETGAPPDATGQDSYSAGQVEYLARLRDWLSQHLRYPSVARERHQTGTAVLRIAVDRNGSVQELELRASTGHALLDREALEVIERARPLPALPEYLGRDRLEVLLNIEFVLN